MERRPHSRIAPKLQTGIAIIAIGAIITLTALPAPAITDQAQAQTNDNTVTMTLFVNYTTTSCQGQGVVDILSVATRFTRTAGSGRKVPVSHVLAMAAGHKCNNVYVQRDQEGTWHPVFGCTRCLNNNTTEALGISVNYPGIRLQPGCQICPLGASGDGHAKTAGGAALLPNPVCKIIVLGNSGSPFGCPDNE